MKGNPEGACSFFQNEYMLDYQISQLRKPHIAVMDRITMGGGAGLSMNGPFRIATERTVFAMPECAIGLFPDVGASRFLNDLPYRMGMYMALTGARLKGAEVKAAGLATHFIESGHLSRLEPQLDALGPKARDWSVVDAVLKEAEALSAHPPMEEFMKKMNAVSSIFGKNSLAQVVEALHSGEPEHRELCQECLNAMGRGSPLSMALVFEQLTRLRDTDLANCLEIEFRLAQRCSRGDADFWEGVRAVLIDKDQNPKWKYPSIDKVPDDVVQELFEQRADLKSLNLQPRAKM
ncbi:unnamed protein product [Ostreobium quekettii]|uniref:3-hydroxyisobutyryl-CoA hydrolase n=1 Tax=Ostreobium quekettii TaxID=121088 RepID=A0A8S1IPN3_9CHLO|nr:unnamed protein product [Ostreobium quekettii]